MSVQLSREIVLKELAKVFPDPVMAKQASKVLDSYGDRR